MKLLDLITDAGTGQLSHTKIWTNIAYAAATAAFIKGTMLSDHPTDFNLWLIYLGIVGGHNIASKLISMIYGGKPNASPIN